MNLSRDSVHALQRHFLGALRAPARTWLEPMPSPPLVFAGTAICSGVLDLGTVSSPGAERCRVRVRNRCAEPVTVRLGDAPSWLAVRWLHVDGDTVTIANGDAAATLEVLIVHDAEREFHGALQFMMGQHIQELRVRMLAKRSHPIAILSFNGSTVPRPFDFGSGERPYELSVANGSSIPLVVTIVDLPAGLTFEVDGRHRTGPIPGPFFERTAPFAVKLRLQLFGGTEGGVVHLHTNDPRPEMQDIALRFAPSAVAEKPLVPLSQPRSVHRVRPEAMIALIALLFFTLLFVIARGF